MKNADFKRARYRMMYVASLQDGESNIGSKINIYMYRNSYRNINISSSVHCNLIPNYKMLDFDETLNCVMD